MLQEIDNLNQLTHIAHKINEYIEICRVNTMFHRKQATEALKWWNFLGIFGVVLTSAQALSMTIETVLESSNLTIAVTGGAFAFAIAVVSRVQIAYSFNSLSIQHHCMADDYDELRQKLLFMLDGVDRNKFDERLYEIHISRFVSINEKNHLQTVTHFFPCKK